MSPSTARNPILQLPPIPQWSLPPSSSVIVKKVVSPCIGITCHCGQNLGRCLVLEQFHCKFDWVHGYVHCILHGHLVPTSLLSRHLSMEHVGDFQGLGPVTQVVEKIQKHLQESYGLEKDQKPPELGWKLKHLIHGNRDIAFSRIKRCPHCPVLFNESRKLPPHYQNAHPDIAYQGILQWADLPVAKIAQMPFQGRENLWYEVLDQHQLTEGEAVALSLSNILLPSNPINPLPPPLFCQELGYVSWIQSLERPPIYNLLAIPGTPLTRNVPGKDGILEKTLLRVHAFLKEYLGSGEQWLFSYHQKLQGILQKGYCFYLSCSSHFLTHLFSFSSRNPSGGILSSPARYRSSLSMVISCFIRLHHLRETGRCPPGLVINITSAQDEARRALYTVAFQKPELSDLVLAQMVHNLCNSLLCARTSSLEKIFGPIEFAFCFYMQQPDGRYRTANNLTQFFASIQWCLRNILGHIIRLQDNGLTSYTPYDHLVVSSSSLSLTSPGVCPSYPNPPEKSQYLTCVIGRELLKDALNDPSSVEWAEKEDQLEASLDSEDLNELDSSEEEDYPVDEGPGDFVVKENTALYLLPIPQCNSGAPSSGSSSQALEADQVILQDSGGLLQYVLIQLYQFQILN